VNAQRSRRRRAALLVLGVLVSLAHWGLAHLLPELRLGDGAADRMPRRIEVAYVRELTPSAPPAAAPVVMPRARPRAKRAVAPKPESAASAPEPEAAAARAASAPPDLAQPDNIEPAAPAQAPVAAAPAASDAVAAAPAASAASAPVAFEWPPSTRLSYSLLGNYQGAVRGSAQVEWVRVGTRYQVHLDVWLGAQAAALVGRRMTSEGELTELGLVPKRYDEQTRALFRELRRRTVLFDGERVLLPDGKVGAWVPGMQDAASQFVQLTWLFTTQPQLLTVGQHIELPLALTTKVDRWVYDVIDKVTLDTPAGPVETFHLRPTRERPSRRNLVADVWFAPSLQYLPVRLLIRQDEQTYVDLTIERLPEQEAAAAPPGAASALR
jgi:hypothetical protein